MRKAGRSSSMSGRSGTTIRGPFRRSGPTPVSTRWATARRPGPWPASSTAWTAQDRLARTILYNLNPADNDLVATMIGNFQDGRTPGKMQYGSGWWFLDQKDGMERQLESLSNQGLLSRFVGMTHRQPLVPLLHPSRVFPPHPLQSAGPRDPTGPSPPRPRPGRPHGRGHLLLQRGGLLRLRSAGPDRQVGPACRAGQRWSCPAGRTYYPVARAAGGD